MLSLYEIYLVMDINDQVVIDMINDFIVSERLEKLQILQIVHLVSISENINELKDNMEWESSRSEYKKIN